MSPAGRRLGCDGRAAVFGTLARPARPRRVRCCTPGGGAPRPRTRCRRRSSASPQRPRRATSAPGCTASSATPPSRRPGRAQEATPSRARRPPARRRGSCGPRADRPRCHGAGIEALQAETADRWSRHLWGGLTFAEIAAWRASRPAPGRTAATWRPWALCRERLGRSCRTERPGAATPPRARRRPRPRRGAVPRGRAAPRPWGWIAAAFVSSTAAVFFALRPSPARQRYTCRPRR